MKEIVFNDISSLRAEISDTYGEWSPPRAVTQEMINGFADITGDRQWIHVDVARAETEGVFGKAIAHGFLILSLLPSLRPPALFKIVQHSQAAHKGSSGLKFISPVTSGSKIRARDRVSAVDEHRLGTLVTTEVAFHLVDSDKPALLYNMQVLYLK